ncbi:hypothetical protein [Spirosoma linguale]|uniref:Uncharacterized protein n=1 Tax=Spirosoma linguale (strain ATCC 33905 / DSM 74 / LMG 10896 / Claus 1) TaxID=504472 RepID=D2QVT6_SPILD|nr:hypothetical protein Slin_6974 [Spirosoma linguale DSM 74]
MKKLLHLSPLLIIAVIYIPSLTFRLFSHDQTYNPVERSTLFLLSSIWLTGCQAAWLWTVGVNLSKKLKPGYDRDLMLLKASLFIPFAYVTMPIVALLSTLTGVVIPFLTFGFYSTLHTIALFCFIYPIYFVASYLTTIEYGKPIKFVEYVSTLLAIVLFPIGVFFVQPRIKKVVNSSSTRYVKD